MKALVQAILQVVLGFDSEAKAGSLTTVYMSDVISYFWDESFWRIHCLDSDPRA